MKTQFIFDLPSLSSARRSTLGLLSALLLSLFLAGCGGDGGGGSFVATPDTGGAGGGIPADQTGSVTFNFTQAQAAPIVVPVGTERLRFEFFPASNGEGNPVLRETRNYAATITIDGVPVTARSVVITAFGADGFPTAQFEANITVVAQQNITVSLTNGTLSEVTLDSIAVAPLSLSLGDGDAVSLDVFAVFSSGDRVKLNAAHLGEASFESGDASIASVEGNVVSAAGTGSTTVTITFRGRPVAVPVTVNLGSVATLIDGLEVAPTTLSLPPGTRSEEPLQFVAKFDGGEDEIVTSGVVQSFPPAGQGISLDSQQHVVVGPSVAPGNYDVRYTYLGQSATLRLTVLDAVIQGITVTPDPVSIPFGGFEQTLTVRGQYSNGQPFLVDSSALTYEALSGGSLYEATDGTTTIKSAASGAAGTGSLLVRYTAPDDQVFEESIEVRVGFNFVQSLRIEPATLSLNPGETRDVTVFAQINDGTEVDVTGFQGALEASSSNTNAVLVNGITIVGVGAPSANVTFTLRGSGSGGGDATGTLPVTVTAITLTSVNYLYAGNSIADSVNTVNLPRGYVGVFEVEATFSNGTTRRLRADEYSLSKDGGANNPDAVMLFQPGDFSIRQPDANYVDKAAAPGTTAGTADHVVDDFVFGGVGGAGLPRTVSVGANSSTATSVGVRSTFRAVAADWYRGNPAVEDARYDDLHRIPNYNVGGGAPAPNSSANIVISVNGYPEFDRRLSVTITDPSGPPTINTIAFANYPGDPNIARNTPRELEVRVTFPEATVPLSLPPYVDQQPNFKLAEANIEFVTDGNVNYTNLIHHRSTEIGYIGITSNVPVNSGLLLVNAQPLAGVAVAPVLQSPPEIVDGEYVAGTYGTDLAVFGQSSGVTAREDSDIYSSLYDPGPPDEDRKGRAPVDVIDRLWQQFNNQNNGFRVVNPLRFTLTSVKSSTSPFNLEVGESTIFRTLVQWAATVNPVTGNLVDDVSRDYPPVVVGGLAEQDVVFGPYRPGDEEPTGAIVVSGVRENGTGDPLADGATVTALDAAGNAIVPAGTGSLASMIVNVIAPVGP